LDRIIGEDLLTARGVYGFWPAASDGDDVIVYSDNTRQHDLARLHGLRQQWRRKGQEVFYSLADFVAPAGAVDAKGKPIEDFVGAFAVTTGIGSDELAAALRRRARRLQLDHDQGPRRPPGRGLCGMASCARPQRLGLGLDEKLSARRPAGRALPRHPAGAGYPAQPDHTEKRTIFTLLDAERHTGIKLTDSLAMHPPRAFAACTSPTRRRDTLRSTASAANKSRLRPAKANERGGGRALAGAEFGLLNWRARPT